MADATTEQTASDVPQAHEGAHYPNPSSKSLNGPVALTDRTDTQRFVWKLFFVLILCLAAMGVVLGLPKPVRAGLKVLSDSASCPVKYGRDNTAH